VLSNVIKINIRKYGNWDIRLVIIWDSWWSIIVKLSCMSG
jgi:hypothetical protein